MLGIEEKIGALANPYNRWQSVLRSSSGKKKSDIYKLPKNILCDDII